LARLSCRAFLGQIGLALLACIAHLQLAHFDHFFAHFYLVLVEHLIQTVVDRLDRGEQSENDCRISAPCEQIRRQQGVKEERQREQEEPYVHVNSVYENGQMWIIEPATSQ